MLKNKIILNEKLIKILTNKEGFFIRDVLQAINENKEIKEDFEKLKKEIIKEFPILSMLLK